MSVSAQTTPEREYGWDQFAPLYDEHHEHLYRVALLLCHGDRAAAEDATAETFIRVHQAWVEGRVDNFFGYARQTLVNHVIGQARRRNVANRHLAKESADRRGDRSTEERVVDSEATFELLQQLPLGQRTAVVLRFYEDMPYDRIAAAMGVSLGTAKSQVSLGLTRMRELMGVQAS
jgi:RNA polymerase sigma factor (sigma-70 family)